MNPKEITNRHQKAVRYMENAREILRTKAGMEGRYYQEAKYVKKACGKAYKAALLALDTWLEMNGKGIKTEGHEVYASDYLRALRDNQDMYNYYNDVWNIVHCSGYQRGSLSIGTIDAGLESADDIIKAIKPSTYK